MQKAARITTLLLVVLLTGACSAFRFPGVFKIDIDQGNIVTQEMLDKLKPGMSRNQVLFVMGSPMLTDTFHDHRWDYYLSHRNGGSDPETRHIRLYFNDNQYTHYAGKIGEALSFEKTDQLHKNEEKPDINDVLSSGH